MIRRKASVGGFLSSPSNPSAQPWKGGGNYQDRVWGAFGNTETGGAWLSSVLAVRCWVKSRNKLNPRV
ncbi:hypothetical protein Lal_00039961 [Lupinus albus]|nr:hypothetical protein Lal_00039961 [Lupinus albus]